jgi:hypothetical protein
MPPATPKIFLFLDIVGFTRLSRKGQQQFKGAIKIKLPE